jgi:hypothetical protein
MPYYVTEEAEGCAGYGVVKEDGELIGCHLTQQDAIDQMVAVSIDEGIEPGGFLEEEEPEKMTPMSASNYSGPTIVCTGTVTVVEAAQGETARREISGVAVPYNKPATVSGGQSVMFKPGSLIIEAGRKPKLMKYHDSTQIVGVVQAIQETADALMFTAKISASRDGNDALELVKDGAIDSVSVGVDPIDAEYDDAGNLVVTKGLLREISLVAEPAFRDARITRVAAAKITNNQVEETKPMDNITAETEKPAPAPTAPIWAEAKRVPSRLPSAAEYVSAYVQGGAKFANVNKLIAEWSAYHNPLEAAAGDVVTTDTPGLLPVPVVGPVYQNINYLRPVVSAIGARAMPNGAGKTFNRPEITTHTSVAQQATELTGLSSTTMVVSSNIVTRLTFGGTALISEQDIDWTDPASVNILLQDMAGQYADATDNYAADQMHSGSTNAGTWSGAADTLLADLYTMAAACASSTNTLPTHMFLSVDSWAKLGGLVDGSDRPLFPSVAPMNAASASYGANTWNGNPLGLQLVVDKNFAAKTIIVGVAAGQFAGFEIYENQKGVIAIDKPEVLGRQISFRGYFATLMIDGTKFQRVNWA